MKAATIRMKSSDVAEILVYDQIGHDPWFGDGVSAKEFREQLKAIKASTIHLRLNSPGGSVIEGAAMLAALDEHPAEIVSYVDGLAASAASVLMMAGSKIHVASNALVMIHNPYAGVLGDANDMTRMADLLNKVKGQAVDAYSRHSKAGREQLSAWMDAETWFTGQEAVDAGLAHEVGQPVRADNLATHIALFAKLGYKRAPVLLDDHAKAETQKRKAILQSLLGR